MKQPCEIMVLPGYFRRASQMQRIGVTRRWYSFGYCLMQVSISASVNKFAGGNPRLNALYAVRGRWLFPPVRLLHYHWGKIWSAAHDDHDHQHP